MSQNSLSFSLLGLHPVPSICGFMSLAKFRQFSIIISLCTFSISLFSPLLQDLNDSNVRFFVIVCQISEALIILFLVYFLSFCSNWVIFIVLSSSSLILYSCHFYSAVVSTLFQWLIAFCSSKTFHFALFYRFEFFAEVFYFSEVSWVCSLKQFFSFFFGNFFSYYLFIYFWLCWVFAAAHRLFLVAASGVHRASHWGFSCWGSQAIGHMAFSSSSARA